MFCRDAPGQAGPGVANGESRVTICHLKLPLALALLLTASHAQALGLGQLQVKSGLGQPLVAEIPVLSATQAELDNLDVRLASADAFARVGLERPLSLSANLQMTVVRDARGLPVIRVTTPGRFNEPFLSFLVEADWGRGSLVREFTALVDPPYIAPAVIRPLQAPTVAIAPAPTIPTVPLSAAPKYNPVTVVQRVEPATPVPLPEPVPAIIAAPAPPPMPYSPPPASVAVVPESIAEFESSPFSQPLPELTPEPEPAAIQQAPAPPPQLAPAAKPAPTPVPVPPAQASAPPAPAPMATPAPAPAASQPGNDQYGPVKDGQTLWSVADRLRQDNSITVNQMMLALQRANPGAFIDENVNRLKSGAVLRIPGREEIVVVLPDEAAALIRQQSGMRPVPQPEQSVAREIEPKPAVAAAPAAAKPVAIAPAKPAEPVNRPRQARLEIVPPAGKSGARSTQSGASASGGGTELRAELSQAKEDLAARQAEVVELKSRVADLEKLQTDSKSLIEMQNSELKGLRDRLTEIEQQKLAAASAPAAPVAQAVVPAAATDTAAAATTATPEVTTPWYQHPGTIGGTILFLALMAWWLSRREKGKVDPAMPSRRMEADAALQASLAKTSAVVDEAADAEMAPVDEDFEKLGLQDMVSMNPRDLEAHLNLLRYLHRKGDASSFEASATDMRGQIGNTTDPRWREVVVMGMGLLPGHPLFSQLGWNAPKFGAEPETRPAPVADVATDAMPSWMRTTAPSQIPSDGAEETASASAAENLTAGEDDNLGELDLTPFDAGSSSGDIHRQEAELQDTDETSVTKIELAKAYLDIGDIEGARAMLEDVLAEGGTAAKEMAANILKELG